LTKAECVPKRVDDVNGSSEKEEGVDDEAGGKRGYSYFQSDGPLFTCIYLFGPPRFDSGVHC
jgi:hypothetical protein